MKLLYPTLESGRDRQQLGSSLDRFSGSAQLGSARLGLGLNLYKRFELCSARLEPFQTGLNRLSRLLIRSYLKGKKLEQLKFLSYS